MAVDLSNYVEVPERIEAFYEKYPDGSLQSEYEITAVGNAPLIIVTARAYRTPDDERPGVGLASEPFPGKTPYTKDSELMNAETSAWGRAIAALGFEVKRGVASANEVRSRQDDSAPAPASNGSPRSALDPKRVKGILDGFRSLKVNYGAINLMLGACGIDGLRANSAKAVEERILSLTDEQATALEDAMAQEAERGS